MDAWTLCVWTTVSKPHARYGNVCMENYIVSGICGFDEGFDMDVLSKLHASSHRVLCARTMVLSKLIFVRKNVFGNSEQKNINIKIWEAWFAFQFCFRRG
jgi:hypothetical protein